MRTLPLILLAACHAPGPGSRDDTSGTETGARDTAHTGGPPPDTSVPDTSETGDSAPGPACGPDDCEGCCDADGACLAGADDAACGTGGEACGDCAGVGLVCQEAVCINTGRAANGFVDDSALHLRDGADVDRVRQDLVDYLWKGEGFPTDLRPASVTPEVASPIGPSAFLAGTDRWTVETSLGFASEVFHLVPVEPNGGLVLLHQGHSATLQEGGVADAALSFLEDGYDVLVLQMPLYGPNDGAASSHDEILAMESDDLPAHPLTVFLEPVVAALNAALDEADWTPVAMIGLSGGGWTTTVAAALDPRIDRSYPVAGSLPLYMREAAWGDTGDSEQWWTSFYAVAGYPDLYAMAGHGAASGGSRSQVQVLNRYDTCCFGGTRYEDYAGWLHDAVEDLDEGSWNAFLDESHRSHAISDHALRAAVIHDLRADGVAFADDLFPPWGAYSTSGTWSTWTDQGFGSDAQSAPAGSGGASATWTFEVPAGTWQVAATWSPHVNRAPDAPFLVEGSILRRIDERAAPADLEDAGASWEILAEEVEVTDGILQVTLTDDASGYVIADGIRIAPAGASAGRSRRGPVRGGGSRDREPVEGP